MISSGGRSSCVSNSADWVRRMRSIAVARASPASLAFSHSTTAENDGNGTDDPLDRTWCLPAVRPTVDPVGTQIAFTPAKTEQFT